MGHSAASRAYAALLASASGTTVGGGGMALSLRSVHASKANIAVICIALAFVGAIVIGIF
jgi:hypothetical protein